MKFTQLAALCALASTAAFAQAKPVWQDFSVTGLYGENYAYPVVGDEIEQRTVTAEYAAGLKYGDFFAFAVRSNTDAGNDTYFVVTPRLSLGAVAGQTLELVPINDVIMPSLWE